MASAQGLLVTGATGFVGGVLVRRLLESRPDARIHCLIRARDAEQLAARRERLLAQGRIPAADADRVVAIGGDIGQPDFGLGASSDRLAVLGREIDEIFHVAASTKFDLALDDARLANLAGTENVLAFARRAAGTGGLRRLHHVSTAYVAGDRAGVLAEDDIPAAPRFRNTYEQTKWEAEQRLARAGDVPITVYRPSIVVGDSRSGRTQHFRVLYDPMRWIYSGKVAVLPCRPEVRLDVVPVDYVCDALLAIAARDDSAGGTYHLSSGPEGGMAIRDIVDGAVAAANAHHAAMGMDPIDPPTIISPEQADAASAEQREQLAAIFALGESVMKTHMPYMLTEQLFDTARTREALAGTGVACPPLRDYLAGIVRWGVERSFETG
jgi:thioester reductase-like protein